MPPRIRRAEIDVNLRLQHGAETVRLYACMHLIARDDDPVSYTHLDVYKRQVQAVSPYYNPTIEEVSTVPNIKSAKKRVKVAAAKTLQNKMINSCLLYTSRCV